MNFLLRACALVLAGWMLIPAAHATDSNMGETSEIAFCNGGTTPYNGCAASDLRLKADQLATPAAIFEYVRNNYDFSLYHGARSGSVNTFLGGRGNDVDMAATLIAMLRSQGVPARYAVGIVRAPSAQVANWLQVEDTTLAKSLLVDQGIQKVTSTTSGSTPTLDFEHVWVEALVPYDQYRGGNVSAVSCASTPSACHWVPMDPSWKQYKQVVSGLDPYSDPAVSFDYTNYYNAIVNANTKADFSRVNKNPLEIYQEQVLAWLGTHAPGKTLEDIPDFRGIVTETDGLLPASLPFELSSIVRNYNSAGDHDAVVPASEPKKWTKQTRLTTTITNGGITLQAGAGTTILTDVATQRLTLATSTVNGTTSVIVRLGGVTIATPITVGGTINGHVIAVGDPFTITVSMDGPPDPTGGGNDTTITATYQAVIGGYYLVATGGETSNWSQVHRAAQQLLAASSQYPIVIDGAQNAYVDTNGNGVYDAGDTPLANDLPAMDALTGGLLYVASTQYFAKLKDDFKSADRLNKIKTPINGFLGVVSSTYQPAEYIDGTAFGVLPSGLLIDMKGIKIGGNWRINAPNTISNSQFTFLGHVASSLEHETWQELTGYDAISTVRGIQMALAAGATLVDAKKNQTTDTMASAYSAFGFTSGSAPSGFTYTPFNLFGTQPATWTNAADGAAFDTMLAQESTSTSALRQSRATFSYSTNNGLYGWVSCVNSQATQLQGYINQGYGNSHFTGTYTLCDGTAYSTSYTVSQIYAAVQSNYTNTVIPGYIGQSYFNYFDIAQGFTPSSYVYRASPCAANAQFTSFVQKIRDNLYLQDLTKAWVEYILPSQQSVGTYYKFAVDIRNAYDTSTGNLASTGYEILNNTGIAAGGGFVAMPDNRNLDATSDDPSDTPGEFQ